MCVWSVASGLVNGVASDFRPKPSSGWALDDLLKGNKYSAAADETSLVKQHSTKREGYAS